MKLSVAVLLLALFTTTLARSPLYKLFRRGVENSAADNDKDVKKIEKEIGQEIEIGEELAKDIGREEKKKGDGDIAVCALELLKDVGDFFEGKGGKGGKDDDDDDDDTKGDGEILAKIGETLAKRMFRIKRRAQGEPLSSVSPSLDPFSRPSSGATGGPSWRPSGPRKCDGALERFFRCMEKSMGEREENKGKGEGMGEGEGEGEGKGEGGETSGESAKTEEPAKRLVHKRKFHKSVA